ncbi:MAG TPA: cytochrome c maturation protein CcmE [Candidatus Limnocylindrales bacterium]|nr:cytochrome c maturation protein CcmE [Candidatus Limnocylindrales bacterium]
MAGADARATPQQPRLSQRRILLIVALLVAVVIAFFAVQSLANSAVYYLTPTEAREKHIGPGTPARLGGLVLAGSLRYDPQTRALSFSISDGTTNVAVVGDGAPPALLKEGAGVVVEGAFAESGTFFRATSVIAKHDEKYAPPSPGTTPRHNVP